MSRYNAGIILTTVNNHKERVLILKYWDYKENGWRWDIPYGGNKKKKDKCPFQTMQREFEEEVGFKLPYIGKNIGKKKEYETFTACENSITFFKCLGPHKYDKIQNMTKDGWKLKHRKREHVKGFLLNVKDIKWREDSAHFYIKGDKQKQEFRKEAYKSLNKAKKKKIISFYIILKK